MNGVDVHLASRPMMQARTNDAARSSQNESFLILIKRGGCLFHASCLIWLVLWGCENALMS
jgi:hypothetical protein